MIWLFLSAARDSELIRRWKSNLTPDQAYNLMGWPLGWNGTEVIYVEKSLASGKSPEEIFSLLTADFDRQSIFRKLQSFAGVCALFRELEAGLTKMLISKFLEEWPDADLPLLNKAECAWIRVVRKRFVISINSELEQKVPESLRSAPERVRFVLPPTGFNEALIYELAVHEETFRHLLGCTEAELKEEQRAAELLVAGGKVSDEFLTRLNGSLGADRFREALHRVGKKRFNLVRSSSGLQGDVLVRAILARQIALFLAEANPSYLRRCANNSCVLYFYDTTKKSSPPVV